MRAVNWTFRRASTTITMINSMCQSFSLVSRVYGKSGKAIIAMKDGECFLLRAGKMHEGGRLSNIYINREREREREKGGKRRTRGEARGGRKEGDREKGIRAGITLGDCGIVNPCRVALVFLSFLSPTLLSLSLSVCLFVCLSLSHPLYYRPPFSLAPSPFCFVHMPFSLFPSLLLSLSFSVAVPFSLFL